MLANDIENILEKFDKLPYDCILIDGKWGIGKTYIINEFVEKNENACLISLFGLDSVEQIYHELLFKTMKKDGVLGKLSASGLSALNKLSQIWEKINDAKEVLDSLISEKDIYISLTKEFNTCNIVVIDDLERISSEIDLKKVLGIIEEIKQYKNVKVVLVSNIEELSEKNNIIFEKFSEKVIDKKYVITELSGNIDWDKLNIDSNFIEDFLKIHKVHNLRTIIKAQNFYKEVIRECDQIEDEDFLNEIRLICYAIVIEHFEKLYFVEESADNKNNATVIYKNAFSYRVGRYIPYIKSSNSLFELIYKYYLNEVNYINEQIICEYKNYLKNGETPIFFKDDKGLQENLKSMENDIEKATNIVELSKVVDEYVRWATIIQTDYCDIIDKYKQKLDVMIMTLIENGDNDTLDYSAELLEFSADEVKSIFEDTITEARTKKIRVYIDYLKNMTNDKKAFDYSYYLRKSYESTYYKSIIDDCIEELLIKSSFPIDDVNEEKYHVCYNIMYVLDKHDEEKLLIYCDDLSKECDGMACYRMEYIVKQIIKGY